MAEGLAITVARERIEDLTARERGRFADTHPRSRELHRRGSESLLSGVPMNWMTRWPGDFPVFMAAASGAELRDVDGNDYTDLCLGDTGAMTGHAPAATIAAVKERLDRGITAMLPTEDAIAVGEEMQRRFGLRDWQFTLSATDANRFVVRIARQITGRSKIIVHNHCYHGSVDETVATLVDGEVRPREGSVGPPVPVSETTRVVEINDAAGLERELADGDVACVLIEPALTNIGIVLADDGYHDAVRELTRAAGTLLVIDETHTLCCGPGGYTRAYGLEPDFLTIGERGRAASAVRPLSHLSARQPSVSAAAAVGCVGCASGRTAAGSRPAPTASRPRSATGSSTTPSGARPTSAASAAPWPETRSRWRPSERRCRRCSPRRRSRT